MKIRTLIPVSLLGVLIAFGGRTFASDLPRATSDHGAFAFTDDTGDRLLVVAEILQPDQFKTALCDSSGRVNIKYEYQQKAREGGTHREAPQNFGALAGSVFRIVGGKVDSAETCFLASDSLLAAATILPVDRPGTAEPCGPEIRERVASARARDAVNCWTIGRLPAGEKLVVVEFARRGKDALAAVVLLAHERTVMADYPGTYRGAGEDVWRVEDGGVLSPDYFQVVFLLQRGDFYALGIKWSGAEGVNLTVFTSTSGDRFTRAISDYWYQAPI
jgi:hypothetical protein